jgi:tRNA nucleotidyltransferase (CCA-adding enzyme)
MPTTHWEHFPHDADIGVRGIGASKEEAFAQAALALTAVITDLDTVAQTEGVEIECEEPDDELLFVDWLNALVYEMAHHRMLFSRFEVHLNHRCLRATAWGEVIDIIKHEPAVEVKGATYTELRVTEAPDGSWLAQCVVDV